MKTEKMKRIKLTGIFILLLIATQSCVVSSLYPLYTDSDRVHLDELDGVWMEDGKVRYEITTIVDSIENKEIVIKSDYKFGADKGDLGEINYAIRHSSKLKEEEFFKGKGENSDKTKSQTSKKERYFFNPHLAKYYQIKIFTEKDTCVLDGNLSKLNDHYFLDVIPNEKYLEKRLKGFIAGLTVRTHGFFKLDFINGDLKINAIEYDDFEELIKNKKIRIEYVEREGEIILTAKTEDIQKFLIKFADSKMFNDPDEALILKRKK